MKKIAILTILAAAMLTSCAKPDKCKCTIKVGDLTLSDQIVKRPEDQRCNQVKVEDIKSDLGSINLTEFASIDCVNYND